MEVKIRPSLIAFTHNYILIALLLLFFFLLNNTFREKHIQLLSLIVGAAIAFYLFDEPLYKKYYYSYEIGKDSITETYGILTKKQKVVPFKNVSEVEIIKNPLGRLLNYGDIKIVSFRGEVTLFGIRNPERIYQIIKEKISKEKS